MRPSLFVFFALTCLAFSSGAQINAKSYAGQETRLIKALSDEDISGFMSGKGMGLAKAAELNGYPGPSHVLSMSDKLQLSQDQIKSTQELFQSMEAQAIALGHKIVLAERELDELFSKKTITDDLLRSSVSAISNLQAKLRIVHLEAHLAQLNILTPVQVAAYLSIRGYYDSPSVPSADHGSHSHSRNSSSPR